MLEANLEDLAREEITLTELREILVRLGQVESGGSELPTVEIVSEVTGYDPVTIGIILSQLRGEAFRRRFGSILDLHEHRIDRLEDQTKSLRSALGGPKSIEPPPKENADSLVALGAFLVITAIGGFLYVVLIALSRGGL